MDIMHDRTNGASKMAAMPVSNMTMSLCFNLVGPPALVPFYLQWYIFYFVVQRKQWAVSMPELSSSRSLTFTSASWGELGPGDTVTTLAYKQIVILYM